MSQRERVVARLLMVVVLAVAGISLVWAETHREPYPALLMPRFSHPGADVDTTSSTTPEITVAFTDGSRETVAVGDLVDTPVHAGRIVGYNFSRGLDATGQLRNPADPSHRQVLLEGWDRGMPPRRGVARAHDPRTAAWLRERVAELHPGRTPTRVTFEWTRRTHRIPEGTVIDTQKVRTVDVDL